MTGGGAISRQVANLTVGAYALRDWTTFDVKYFANLPAALSAAESLGHGSFDASVNTRKCWTRAYLAAVAA